MQTKIFFRKSFNLILPLLIVAFLGFLTINHSKLAKADSMAPGFEAMTETNSTAPLAGLALSPLRDTAVPGSTVQVVSKAHYAEGRLPENTTSCFPCPTINNQEAKGKVTYKIVSGPGKFTGSKIAVNEDATPGEVIVFKAEYYDEVSGTSNVSRNQLITVVKKSEVSTEALLPNDLGQVDKMMEEAFDLDGEIMIEEVETTEETEVMEEGEPADETVMVEESKMEVSELSESSSGKMDSIMEQSEGVEAPKMETETEALDKVADLREAAPAQGGVIQLTIQTKVLYWAVTILILLLLGATVAKRRLSKIDHLSPEHRAKENELYEAFGLDVHHDHDLPEHHKKKQHEVEDAFKKMLGESQNDQSSMTDDQ